MIELQRAKLGLPPAGTSPAAPIHTNAQSPGKGNLQSPQLKAAPVPQTPQEAAAAEVLAEDAQLQRFIHRMQRRDDSNPMVDSSTGPTVPTALSRRMLQRQGVGYLDPTVGAVISASADRFLATVLQQAIACRDQRLKGAEMARQAARQRKRHIQNYEADMDDRKRRRQEVENSQERAHLQLIAKAESLKKGGGSSKDDDDKKKKKKKTPEDSTVDDNGNKGGNSKGDLEDDHDESYDSIDEEEDYYQQKLGDVENPHEEDDEDEEDDTLLLRDLVRPLEAWDFHLTGKEALEDEESDEEEEEGLEDDEDRGESGSGGEDVAKENGGAKSGADGSKPEQAGGDDGEDDPKRKATASPTPKTS